MNAVNNGYLGFEHVRIPRESLLMKNSKVLKVIPLPLFVQFIDEQ